MSPPRVMPFQIIPLATRAINKRVELLGRRAGVEGLSVHDCRHYAETFEARQDRPIDRLVEWWQQILDLTAARAFMMFSAWDAQGWYDQRIEQFLLAHNQ